MEGFIIYHNYEEFYHMKSYFIQRVISYGSLYYMHNDITWIVLQYLQLYHIGTYENSLLCLMANTSSLDFITAINIPGCLVHISEECFAMTCYFGSSCYVTPSVLKSE